MTRVRFFWGDIVVDSNEVLIQLGRRVYRLRFRKCLSHRSISQHSHPHTALLNCNSTQDAQVAGIVTTKIGYVNRFKDSVSVEVAHLNPGG
jgi:hypothetical protein